MGSSCSTCYDDPNNVSLKSDENKNTETMIVSSRDFKNQKNIPRVSEYQGSSKLKRFTGTNKEEDMFEIGESEEREVKINEARVSHPRFLTRVPE